MSLKGEALEEWHRNAVRLLREKIDRRFWAEERDLDLVVRMLLKGTSEELMALDRILRTQTPETYKNE